MDFEMLRQMESFSEEMLNRIIAFQSKEHPVWNTARPFDERIRGLALHDLVFSHPHRDPAQFGPTISHFYPRRTEMQRLAQYAHAVAKDPLVVDAHARNGFIGSLLARERVRVIGFRDPALKNNQIADLYDPACYELRQGSPGEINMDPDVVLSAWMPAGRNVTPDLLKLNPKLIVFIFTEHVDTQSRQPQTGTPEAFDGLPSRYRLVDEWKETRPADLFRGIWPDLTGNIEETRTVRVFADEPFHQLTRPEPAATKPHYDWEQDLEMALLAHEAKRYLERRGVPLGRI